MEANYGNDALWGPWPKCPLTTPMVVWQLLYSTVLVLDNDY